MQASKTVILIIEDSPDTRYAIQKYLELEGFQVVTAGRALDGVDIAKRVGPHLILTDINLPDMTGRELATMLRSDARFSNTPIVALTAEDDKTQRDMAFAAGINGYLIKPIDPDELIMHIQFFMSGGTDGLADEQELDEARTRYMQDVVQRLEGQIRVLEEKNEELKRIDQMKDTFIQLTAHELRTPLTLITGYSRLLEDHPPLQEMMREDESISVLIEGLSESIARMQGIIEEILTTSRIMTSEIELDAKPTNLGAIVRKVLQEYKSAFHERRLSVRFDESQWPSSMRADGALLRLVIDNLVSNAIKYTPDGGRIFLTSQQNGQLVRFTIKDTGIGIAKEDHERIFERFHIGGNIATHTTSKTAFNGGGLGLGLAISQGIVEAHGGRISVDSPGHDPKRLPGSEFIVVLPLMTQSKSKPKPLEHGKKKLKRLPTRNTG